MQSSSSLPLRSSPINQSFPIFASPSQLALALRGTRAEPRAHAADRHHGGLTARQTVPQAPAPSRSPFDPPWQLELVTAQLEPGYSLASDGPDV